MAKKVSAKKKSKARRAVRDASAEGAVKGTKYVYLFGKQDRRQRPMKPLLGGKGANLAEMSRIGLPVPPGFTITTEVCTYYYANKRTYPERARGADGGRRRLHREDHGHEVRRPAAMPLLVVRPLRRARFDAGHDGHDSEPRPQRPDGVALVDDDEERALRLGLLPPLRPDVWRRRPRRAEAARTRITSRSKTVIHELKHERYHADIEDTEADRRRPEGTRRPLQGARSRSAPARNSRKIRGSSSGARPAPCSARG